MIRDLAVAFRDLIQFRIGPQDLPHAPRVLGVLVLAVLVMQMPLAQLPTTQPAPGPLREALALGFELGLLYALLTLKQFGNRYVQTALGWVGAELIFLALVLPFFIAMGKPPTKPEEVTPQQLVLVWPLLGVIVWKLAVQAHVLRHALETKLSAAVFLTLFLHVAATVLFGASAE